MAKKTDRNWFSGKAILSSILKVLAELPLFLKKVGLRFALNYQLQHKWSLLFVNGDLEKSFMNERSLVVVRWIAEDLLC